MYNLQCLAGHVYEALPGSNLEKRCIERERQGYLDALILSAEECLDCHGEDERRDDKLIELLGEDWNDDLDADDDPLDYDIED